MRLILSGRQPVILRGQAFPAFVRRLSGGYQTHPFSAYDDETLQLIFPSGTQISPGETAQLGGKPYRCLYAALYPGSVQAVVRRLPA